MQGSQSTNVLSAKMLIGIKVFYCQSFVPYGIRTVYCHVVQLEMFKYNAHPHITDMVHGKYLVGENFGKSYRWKLLARKNLANKQQSVHSALYVFRVSEYWWRKFWWMAHDSPIFSSTKIFLCTVIYLVWNSVLCMKFFYYVCLYLL